MPGRSNVRAGVDDAADLVARVRREVLGRGMMRPGSCGVVAFSGGPDSLCLLHSLAALREDLGVTLRALHIDHGLRSESQDEAARAMALAAQVGISAELSVAPPDCWGKGNLQQQARLFRREALLRCAASSGAAWIALGHTADDQAETVLMRLVRGTGLAGLGGMAYVSGIFCRPLLGVTRREVEGYLAAQGLVPLRDPTNETDRYFRNRLRRGVLTALCRENPRLIQGIAGLAETLREDEDALEQAAAAAWDALSCAEEGAVMLPAKELSALPRAVLARLLRRAICETTGSTRRITRRHLLGLFDLLRSTAGTALRILPGLTVERRYGRLYFCAAAGRDRGEAAPLAALAPLAIAALGRHQLSDGSLLQLRLATAPLRPDPGEWLDPGKIAFPLLVRGRQRGDQLCIGGGHHRRVSRLLIDAKIPRCDRDRVPLLLAQDRVAAVVGLRCAADHLPLPLHPAIHVTHEQRKGGSVAPAVA